MPIPHVSKSQHLHGLALSPRSSVGIVLQAAYDLVLRPYRS
jgi:hypothetical protein